jgi:N-dimethylarginine dimethylaminohydrolase
MPAHDSTSTLRRVFVRPPGKEDAATWRDYSWHSAPDPLRAAAEHEAFRRTLAEAGADVIVGATPVSGDIDAIYVYDTALMTEAGTIMLRPGKELRRAEPRAVEADLSAVGVSIAERMQAPGTAEGGDMFWLDERTLLVGRGYRTNDDGIRQLRGWLEPLGVEIVAFDLPHAQGPQACMHLMTFISPIDHDLALVFAPLVPVRLMELLDARGVGLIEVPQEELATQGPNVLALGPRTVLALEGNPETRRRMKAEGVHVRTYVGTEISLKGDGGPTCLTRPLVRG